MKYDLKAMVFEPDKTDLDGMFWWCKTPEGHEYWSKYCDNPHQEGRDKIAAMHNQWKEEQAMTEPTRPAIGVLHQHNRANESPVPMDTECTLWMDHGTFTIEVDNDDDWIGVTEYLVHSYPETKQVTGTVTYTNGEPDFSTWKETE